MLPSGLWPPDDQTLMWLQVATGFSGGLTTFYWLNWLRRRFGSTPDLAVHFSPKGGCQEALVREIKAARREILVQAYSFTADPLTFALIDAEKRGLQVDILLDRSNEAERYSDLTILLGHGVKPLIDAEHAIAHNKVMVIDQKTIATGSYNFTNQAESENAENLVLIKGMPELARAYRANFLAHKAHSRPPGQKAAEHHRAA